MHLFGTSNFIEPGYHAALLFLVLGSTVLLFVLTIVFLANSVRRYEKCMAPPITLHANEQRDKFDYHSIFYCISP